MTWLFILLQPNSLTSGCVKFVFNASKYEFEGMALCPSCKGLEVDLVDQSNHEQEFMHVMS